MIVLNRLITHQFTIGHWGWYFVCCTAWYSPPGLYYIEDHSSSIYISSTCFWDRKPLANGVHLMWIGIQNYEQLDQPDFTEDSPCTDQSYPLQFLLSQAPATFPSNTAIYFQPNRCFAKAWSQPIVSSSFSRYFWIRSSRSAARARRISSLRSSRSFFFLWSRSFSFLRLAHSLSPAPISSSSGAASGDPPLAWANARFAAAASRRFSSCLSRVPGSARGATSSCKCRSSALWERTSDWYWSCDSWRAAIASSIADSEGSVSYDYQPIRIKKTHLF